MIHNDIKSILISEEEIAKAVSRIADEINRDYEGKEIELSSIADEELDTPNYVSEADIGETVETDDTFDSMYEENADDFGDDLGDMFGDEEDDFQDDFDLDE